MSALAQAAKSLLLAEFVGAFFLSMRQFFAETREELYYDKDKLLANGDRWERELARNLELDAPYR